MSKQDDEDSFDLDHSGDWNQHRMLVMAELKRMEVLMLSIQKDILYLRVELTALKVKASVWGALGGLLSSVGACLMAIFIYWISKQTN